MARRAKKAQTYKKARGSEANENLLLALKARDAALVEQALAAGADLHLRGCGLLSDAARRNRTDMAKLLLTHGAAIHADQSLRQAIVHCNLETAALLLDHGADANASWEKSTPLLVATSCGDAGMARLLLDRGADLHANNNAALCTAACCGHHDVVRLLLERGGNIAGRGRSGTCDFWGLKRAAGNGYRETVDLLLEHIFRPEAWTGKNMQDVEAMVRKLTAILQYEGGDAFEAAGANYAIRRIEHHSFPVYHQARAAHRNSHPLRPRHPQSPAHL